MTNIEIEHHFGWTQHAVGEGVSLADAAYAAVLATHAFLTLTNHTREDVECDDRSGLVYVRRAVDAEPLADPRMRRLAETFGNKAGDLWFSTRWRLAYAHGTLAVDDFGRRWAFVRLASGYGKWECVTDLQMIPWELPGPDARRSCCGSGNLEGKVCTTHGGPWLIGGQASVLELRRVDAVRLQRHELMLLADIDAKQCTLTQAAARARCGRGQEGRDNFTRHARRLLADLAVAHAVALPIEALSFDEIRRHTLALAGAGSVTARAG